MTSVTIKVVSNRIPQLPAAIKQAAAQQVETTARQIEATSKGLAPVRTGTLRRSIHTVLEAGGLRALVGPSVLYGKFVEFGTRRMGARPYMRPAAERHMPGFAAGLAALLRKL